MANTHMPKTSGPVTGKRKDDEPEQEGAVLDISRTEPHVKIPVSGRRDSASVEGIEVTTPATGLGDVPKRSGATGADLGGNEGADITPTATQDVGKKKKDAP